MSSISNKEIQRSLIPNNEFFIIDYKDENDIQRELKIRLSEKFSEMHIVARLISIENAIANAIEIHFGIRIGLISDALLKAVIQEIIEKYGNLCYPDIEFAFDRYVKQKHDDWKNPSKSEIMNPISMWWNQKESIKYEFQKFQKDLRDKEESQAKGIEFEHKSLQLYKESDFEFTGDYFQASAIAKKYFGSQLDQETKDQLWLEAKKQKKQNDEQAENKDRDMFNLIDPNFGISAERIFCKLVLNKCLELGIEPNIFKD